MLVIRNQRLVDDGRAGGAADDGGGGGGSGGGSGGGGEELGLSVTRVLWGNRTAQPEMPLQFITTLSLISIYQDGALITLIWAH